MHKDIVKDKPIIMAGEYGLRVRRVKATMHKDIVKDKTIIIT